MLDLRILQTSEPLRCDLCGITAPTHHVMKNHLEGKAHKRKLKNEELLKKLQETTNTGVSEPTDDSKPFEVAEDLAKLAPIHILRCDICDMTVNSAQQLNIHFSGSASLVHFI